MKLMRVGPSGAEIPGVLVADGSAYDVRSVTSDFNVEFFATGGLDRLRSAVADGGLPVLDASGRTGPPIPRPGKIVCVGLNYHKHAQETGARVPDEPVLFMKAANTVIGPTDSILIPRGSTKTDWEVELAIVIGKTSRYLDSPDESPGHIAGYAISHDVSERHFQLERGGQWDKGKSCETFNPFGPYVVTADEVADPQDLQLRLWLNEELRQDGNTSDMVFSVNHIVWYISQFMVLEPGDIVNTGTPSGVAMGMAEPRYLKAGDVVDLEVTGLGHQRQELVQA